MNAETWIIIVVFLGIVLVTQMGRRQFTTWRMLMPIVIVAYLYYKYARVIPTTGHDFEAVMVCSLLGAILGLGMVFSVRLERDGIGKLFTNSGVLYLILWIVALGSRVAFAYDATNWDPMQVERFMVDNHLSYSVIGPAFIFMTAAMILVRTLGIVVRARGIKPMESGTAS